MAGMASAQIGTATGSANGALACVATAAGTPELRPEGFTELAGDILITCTGGPVMQLGSVIPTTNITVYMQPGVPITSRFISSNGASEALLIIDDAGSGLASGVTGNYGPKAPQVLCSYTQQQTSGGTNQAGACPAYVGTDGATPGYEIAVTAAGGTTASANVYQGKVGDFGAQSVTFYAVPVLPPATTGVSRTFRITNIRVPAVSGYGLSTGVGNISGGVLTAIISTSPSTVLPINIGPAINIGVVGPAMLAAVNPKPTNGGSSFAQCNQPAAPTLTAQIVYTEGFATAFKTRVVPGGASNGTPGSGTTAWDAEAINTAAPKNQNIPGGLYGGFAQNSESGFILPTLNTGTKTAITAGLADYGTRLKAVFYNVPAGITLYVSTVSTGTAPSPVGGTSVTPYAVLVSGSASNEAVVDGTTFGTSGLPLPATTTGFDSTGANGYGVYPLVADATGKYVAIWEVTNANPSATDSITFGVYINYVPANANGIVGSPLQYGSPQITGLPLTASANDVMLSMAPEPGGGTFVLNALATQGQVPTPRFAVINKYEGPWVTINLCQTTLLYPYVIQVQGFDTGIAIANASMDPFTKLGIKTTPAAGTIAESGSCTLYPYGVTINPATQVAGVAPPPVAGCDTISNGQAGTNCFPIITPGSVQTVDALAVLPNFQGYVIAVCNFQYAHGYAAITDLGARNMFSAYLALELNYNLGLNEPRGVSIEQNMH
jgi:hypothetical protein